MRIIKNEQVVFFDVDSTLVFSVDPKHPVPGREVKVYDSVTDSYITMIENQAMVRLLREEKHRGGHITVWSRGGYEYAANVVKALGLESLVDQVMSKPMAYMDYLDISEWLKYRVYLPPTKVYKK